MTRETICRLGLETSRHLERFSLTASPAPRLADLAARFSQDIECAVSSELPEQHRMSGTVRALQYAPQIFEAPPDSQFNRLQRAAKEAFAYVRWSEYYAESSWSHDFLPSFANGEGIGPDGRYRHDSLILGLFILGPNTFYPAHAHPADEFYITVGGSADFQVGARAPFEQKVPGDIVIHESQVSHAIRTGERPFFAIFGWRGAIHEPSWYRDDMTDDTLPIRHPLITKA